MTACIVTHMVSPKEPRILILEDERVIAWELQETLERFGYEVVGPAHSCEAALELLWSNEVDAAILDVMLGEGTCEVSLTNSPSAAYRGHFRLVMIVMSSKTAFPMLR